MKKLLLSTAVVLTATASAQVQHPSTKADMTKVKAEKVSLVPQMMTNVDQKFKGAFSSVMFKAPRKAEASSYHYAKIPSGTLLLQTADNGYSWNNYVQVHSGAFEDVVFENYTYNSSNEHVSDVTWDFGTNNDGTPITPNKAELDEYGNLTAQGFGYYSMPTCIYGDDSFPFTANDKEVAASWACGTAGFIEEEINNEVSPFTVGNFNSAYGNYGGFSEGVGFITNIDAYQNSANGLVSTGKKCVGFAESFAKPTGVVYAKDVVLRGWVDDDAELSSILEGNTLTATIYTFDEDGKLEFYAEGVAEESDITVRAEYRYLTIVYTFGEDNPLFGHLDFPIVLPDQEFIVIFSGFENLTSSFTANFCSADGWTGSAYQLLEDGTLSTIGYSNQPQTPQCRLNVGFHAAYPVATYSNQYNLPSVFFWPEGGYGAGAYDEEDDKYYSNITVFSLTGKDEWEFIEGPDWVKEWEIDDTYVTNGILYFMLQAEPLPDGVDYRSGEVEFQVYGKSLSIPVVQTTDPSLLGVNSVVQKKVNNHKLVNMAGQEVNAQYKGMVISNGKKYIKK